MPNKITVGLVQIGDCFGDHYFFPYSIGMLQSYAKKHLTNYDEYNFLPPVYKRDKVKDLCEYLDDASVIFFSTYLWNFKLSLAVAEELKKKHSDKTIIFGGPQVPEQSKNLLKFLNRYSQIDIGCYGEGEIPFVRILERYNMRKKWDEVPSIGYMNKDGIFIMNEPAKRITDLDSCPSPYIEGIFNPLIDLNPKDKWNGLIETNRGCPFSCTYCAWGSDDKKRIYQFGLDRIFQEIDWFSDNKIEFIFCCDANFGMFKRDLEIVRKVASNKVKTSFPQVFSVQNTKNSTEKIFQLHKVLNEAGLQKGVNLALQSVNEETLKSIRRANIKNDIYQELQKRFTVDGIPTFTDIILALPEEDYNTFTEGVSSIIEGGQHNRIQLINLSVLENTKMADSEYINKHGLILQESKVIPHHTSLKEDEEIFETHNLVIGNKVLSKEEWIRERVFCWLVSLLHFNKLLQIPFIVLNKVYSKSYKELVETFLSSKSDFTVLAEVIAIFEQKALDIQSGGQEFIPSKEWLNVWWPVDEYVFIKLCFEEKLSQFYSEAEMLIVKYLLKNRYEQSSTLLKEAMLLNECLIKRPFIKDDLSITLKYNVPDFYRNILTKNKADIKEGEFNYTIDKSSQQWWSWEDWFREVVWYGTKKGAYLYSYK